MTRKRKTFYPPARTARRRDPAVPGTPNVPPTVVAIDTKAGIGRAGFKVGSRVRILGSGRFAGELAFVERLVGGVIPAALVRTEAGVTRQVRTIDLEPAAPEARPGTEPPAGG